MKRLNPPMPRRPVAQSAKVARNPKDAAIQLVRLEFDAARLRTGIEQASRRVRGYRIELDHNQAQRQTLIRLMAN